MKRQYEQSKKLLKKDWKYICEFNIFRDIINYLKSDKKTLPYLQKLEKHENLFKYNDVCIIVDDVYLLYAKSKNNKYPSLVDVIRLTVDEVKIKVNDEDENEKKKGKNDEKNTDTEEKNTEEKEKNEKNTDEKDESDTDDENFDVNCIII